MSTRAIRPSGDPAATPRGADRRRAGLRLASAATAMALMAGIGGAGAQEAPDAADLLQRQVDAATRLDPASASTEDLVAAITVIDQAAQTLVARGSEAQRAEADAGRRLEEIAGEEARLREDVKDTVNTLRRVAVRLYVQPDRQDASLRALRAHSADEAQQRRVLAESAAGSSRESIEQLRAARVRIDELEGEAGTVRSQAEQSRSQRERLFVEHATAAQAQERLQVEWLKRVAASKGGSDAGKELTGAIAGQGAFTSKAAPAPAARMAKPVNVPAGSPFGTRNGKPHTGIDFPAPTGTPVRAALGGRVTQISTGDAWNGAYGNWVVLAHANGMVTRYAHLSRVSVSVGQTVAQGDLIGNVGETGDARGAHLHFEVLVNGRFQNPANYL